jgi:hypothetical protein
LARPFPVGDLHLLFFASFPGALRTGPATWSTAVSRSWLRQAVCRRSSQRRRQPRRFRLSSVSARTPSTGLVSSLDHPGGNITGVTSMTVGIGSKRLGLLRDLLPRATRVAVLVDQHAAMPSPLGLKLAPYCRAGCSPLLTSRGALLVPGPDRRAGAHRRLGRARMPAFGESCRRRGHAVVSLTDPEQKLVTVNCCVATRLIRPNVGYLG